MQRHMTEEFVVIAALRLLGTLVSLSDNPEHARTEAEEFDTRPHLLGAISAAMRYHNRSVDMLVVSYNVLQQLAATSKSGSMAPPGVPSKPRLHLPRCACQPRRGVNATRV